MKIGIYLGYPWKYQNHRRLQHGDALKQVDVGSRFLQETVRDRSGVQVPGSAICASSQIRWHSLRCWLVVYWSVVKVSVSTRRS